MFWNRTPKCPITAADQEWVRANLKWLNNKFVNLRRQKTVIPSTNYLQHEFQGTEEDAHYLLAALIKVFKINPNAITLEFYSEKSIELGPGMVTQKEDGKGSAGLFVKKEQGRATILLEQQQLKNTSALIATLAHELSHYILHQKAGYLFSFHSQEEEWLTDLTAIAYGFGLFLGNSKFNFQQWQSGDGWGGWSAFSQGYLPVQVIAYAMAEIQLQKKDLEPAWEDLLGGDFKRAYKRSAKYLMHQKQQ